MGRACIPSTMDSTAILNEQLLAIALTSFFLQITSLTSMLHILVPGHGRTSRTHTMMSNIAYLRQQIQLECTIFVYDTSIIVHDNHFCRTIYKQGYWTDFMNDLGSNASYIGLLMDDVVLGHVNVTQMIRQMEIHKLDVLAPSIRSWHHPIMRRRYTHHLLHQNVLGETPVFSSRTCPDGLRMTHYVDMLFVMFSSRAWSCWKSLFDINNSYGWGYDLVFWHKCRMRMCIQDHYWIRHPESSQTTYSHRNARQSMFRFLMHQLPMNLSQAKRYRLDVLRGKTSCLRSCTRCTSSRIMYIK